MSNIRRRVAILLVAMVLGLGSMAAAQLPFEHNPRTDPYRSLFDQRGGALANGRSHLP